MIYPDSGCLVKFYYPEPDSSEVVKSLGDESLFYTRLHELEIVSALEGKLFRGEATSGVYVGRSSERCRRWHAGGTGNRMARCSSVSDLIGHDAWRRDWHPGHRHSSLCNRTARRRVGISYNRQASESIGSKTRTQAIAVSTRKSSPFGGMSLYFFSFFFLKL